MAKVLHRFVDAFGRTRQDEYELGPLTLDMGEVPERYLVFLFTRCNAGMIYEAWRDTGHPRSSERVMLACPPDLRSWDEQEISWDKARTRVRELCFENLPAACGGLRPIQTADAITAQIINRLDMAASQAGLHQKLPEDSGEKGARRRLKKAEEAMNRILYGQIPQRAAAVAAHPLWKRVAWISGMHPTVLECLLTAFVDPTWYVDSEDPLRSTEFKKAYFSPGKAVLAGVALSHLLLNITGPETLKEVDRPGQFFLRVALRYVQRRINEGHDRTDPQLWIRGEVAAAEKLANYFWLCWMGVLHSDWPPFDAERFFYGDAAAIAAHERAGR